MVVSPDRLEALRQILSDEILNQFAEALLDCSSLENLRNPVLRLEAFVENGDNQSDNRKRNRDQGSPIVSQIVDISGILAAPKSARLSGCISPPPSSAARENLDDQGGGVDDSGHGTVGFNAAPALSVPSAATRVAAANHAGDGTASPRRMLGALRPAPERDVIDTNRQMEVIDSFPKRAKTQAAASLTLEQPTLTKFVTNLWDQLHGSAVLEPQLLEGLALLTSVSSGSTLLTDGTAQGPSREIIPATARTDLGITTAVSSSSGAESLFSRSNVVCRKVTQASRTCRSVEVIVQARWVEEFDEYVECLAAENPAMSQTKCRKAALMEACRDFQWSEKELRNKMAVWRSYKDVKDAAGWSALVFSGMGLYRLCKYRIGLNQKGLDTLRRLRPRLEVVADTLHPQWRQLLAFIGQSTRCTFTGHPHDWVVQPDGSDPVPLLSTYREPGIVSAFKHLEESVVDTLAWHGDDPRYVPPVNVAAPLANCHACGQTQSDDPEHNQCCCFPALFGSGRRRPASVQVFRTQDGRNNGLLALTSVERGVAIGEFVGLITKGVEDLDVMNASTGVRSYQIWQGRQGNYTRFINHSCNPNAQFQHFIWQSTQRIILVSKGIEAGSEITVDYSESYWSGLNKRCLCAESCCRYS
ncbi:hypothetical protein LMH87_002770 [Akanthomyces muscarius]|uniref:SET domain-containing protein n=1 Tax=Akanthomyces muscarius TaxID=2231603 RepID=A0A9W8Q6Z3_AKAMU|nr:hypothetical protein LMH87_002770 [Akanthomyces muscarius]KAJ4148292.1 hypothetical protein LMH87_002770 [Akanthomyces muscarius]